MYGDKRSVRQVRTFSLHVSVLMWWLEVNLTTSFSQGSKSNQPSVLELNGLLLASCPLTVVQGADQRTLKSEDIPAGLRRRVRTQPRHHRDAQFCSSEFGLMRIGVKWSLCWVCPPTSIATGLHLLTDNLPWLCFITRYLDVLSI